MEQCLLRILKITVNGHRLKPYVEIESQACSLVPEVYNFQDPNLEKSQ